MPGIGAFISGCAQAALSPDERDFFRAANPWGLILFRRNIESPKQLRALTADFRACVGRANAPVFIDQEGGRVQRMGPPHWRKYPPGARYGELYAREREAGLEAAHLVARLMAADLRDVGINADCLPVLDVPQPDAHDVIGDRAYGHDPATVAALARAAVEGLLAGGVLPVIKHIPGHGRARADSHLNLPVVEASRAELERVDFPPFRALADAPMAMTAHVVYTALDPELPATLSPTVIGMMREELGFNGLIMCDDVSMKALSGSFSARAAQARAAGCDVALHCNGVMAEMVEVARGAGVLDGPAARRAEAALARLREPEIFDENQALARLAAVSAPAA